jgi:hypothetical protein
LGLVSNGALRKGRVVLAVARRVVLAVALLESVSWLLGMEFYSPGELLGSDAV